MSDWNHLPQEVLATIGISLNVEDVEALANINTEMKARLEIVYQSFILRDFGRHAISEWRASGTLASNYYHNKMVTQAYEYAFDGAYIKYSNDVIHPKRSSFSPMELIRYLPSASLLRALQQSDTIFFDLEFDGGARNKYELTLNRYTKWETFEAAVERCLSTQLSDAREEAVEYLIQYGVEGEAEVEQAFEVAQDNNSFCRLVIRTTDEILFDGVVEMNLNQGTEGVFDAVSYFQSL